MATRFRFSQNLPQTDGVTPTLEAWDRTPYFERRTMHPTDVGPPNGSYQSVDSVALTPNQRVLRVQGISPPMMAGIGFTTAQTGKGVVLAYENSAAGNMNRQPICLKIVSRDGTTIRSVLLALGHYGPSTTEWAVSPGTNRQLATGAAFQANYTTVAGDRLVLEIGGQVDGTGSADSTSYIQTGSGTGGDCVENETDTDTTKSPWFEVSTDITFLPPSDTGGYTMAAIPWGR